MFDKEPSVGANFRYHAINVPELGIVVLYCHM